MFGLVLKTHACGEKDLIVRVLTAEQGKISVFARRNRSNRKQSGTLLEAMDRGTFDLNARKGDLFQLRSYRPASSYPKIRTSIDKLSLAYFLLETADLIIPEESGSDDGILDLMTTGLEELANSETLQDSLKITFNIATAIMTSTGYCKEDFFGTASTHSLRTLVKHIEHFAERELLSKESLLLVLKSFHNKNQPIRAAV